MRAPKSRTLLAVAAAGLLLAAAAVRSFNTLAGEHRQQVQQELQKVLGKAVTYERLTVSVFGGPGFAAEGFRIADNPRFAATPLLSADELLLGVSWWHLFLGRIVIDSMTFNRPEFQIITDESGSLNLAELGSRRTDLGEFPRSGAPNTGRRSQVRFAVEAIGFHNGRIHYIDRSVREPAELQIRNVVMTLRGLDASRPSKFTLAAALTEALDEDVHVEGTVGPFTKGLPWSEQPVDLRFRLDSLYVPLLGRAVAFLRNKIPRELDVTGPMAFRATVRGTFGNPRITDVTLNVPLFGSSDYNAVLEGAVDLTESPSWRHAELDGSLTLTGIDLRQLRRFDFFRNNVSPEFAGAGTVSVHSRFAGTWEKLRVGMLVNADESEIQLSKWLRKPAGVRARLEARISRHKDALLVHESPLVLGGSEMTVAARIDDAREPRAQLRLQAAESRLELLGEFFTPWGLHGMGGTAVWDLVASKHLASYEHPWALTGRVNVIKGQFRHTTSGRMVEDLQANVQFVGRKVRVEGASFRLNGTRIALDGHAPSPAVSPLHYRARATEINLTDLDVGLALPPGRLRDVAIEGVIHSEDVILTRAALSSAHGTLLNDVSYRNLKANVTWSGGGLAFSDLRLEALDGTLQGEGRWLARAEDGFDIVAQFDSTDVRSALPLVLPQIEDRLTGRLHLRTRLQGTGNGDGQKNPQAQLRGSGEAAITRGAIKDFNLLTHVFSGGTGSPTPSTPDQSLPAPLAVLAQRADTPFETLKSKLVLERQGLRLNDLVLSTPDYTLTGSGSIGFDRSTRWNGSISLSPAATQQLQREFTALRYFVDRRGRLSFSFRADGKLPHVKVRYENRALAQILRPLVSPRSNGQAAPIKKETRDKP